MVADADFRNAWLKAKRQQARPIFEAQVAPALAKYGVTNMDKAFGTWFTDMIASIAPADLDPLINTTYRMLAKEEVATSRSKTEAEFDQAKNALEQSCKSDVAYERFRAFAKANVTGTSFVRPFSPQAADALDKAHKDMGNPLDHAVNATLGTVTANPALGAAVGTALEAKDAANKSK